MALAWCWSIVMPYGVGDWFPRAVSTYYLQPAWVGIIFFFAVTTLTAAPACAAFALCWRILAARPGTLTPFFAATAWVGAELVRARLLGDPWALFGYPQVPHPVLLQVAEATGIYGTSVVLAAMNAALAGLWLRHRRGGAGALAAAACVLALAGFGMLRMRALDDAPTTGRIATAVVQANLDLGSQWRPELYGRNLGAHLDLSIRALAHQPTPRLVIWPESAVSFFLNDEPEHRRRLQPRGRRDRGGHVATRSAARAHRHRHRARGADRRW